MAALVVLPVAEAASSIHTMSGTLPLPVAWGSAVWDGSGATIFGGLNATGAPLPIVIRYDPVTDTARVASARLHPHGAAGTAAVWNGTHAFIFGGYDAANGTGARIVQRYDPATDAMETLPVLLPPNRGVTAVWNGTHALLFLRAMTAPPLVLAFHPPSMTLGAAGTALWEGWTLVGVAAAHTDRGTFLFGGGTPNPVGGGLATASSTIWRYDSHGDRFDRLDQELPAPLAWSAPVAAGSVVYLVGGYHVPVLDAATTTDEILVFDPSGMRLSRYPDALPLPAAAMASTWTGNKTYLFGGGTLDPANGGVPLDGSGLTSVGPRAAIHCFPCTPPAPAPIAPPPVIITHPPPDDPTDPSPSTTPERKPSAPTSEAPELCTIAPELVGCKDKKSPDVARVMAIDEETESEATPVAAGEETCTNCAPIVEVEDAGEPARLVVAEPCNWRVLQEEDPDESCDLPLAQEEQRNLADPYRPTVAAAQRMPTAPLLMLLAAEAAALVVLFAWAKRNRRRLPIAAAPLFTRLERGSLLEHPVRARIHSIVEAEPGIHYNELLRRAGTGRGAMDHHLKALLDHELLKEHATRGYRCYFLAGMGDRGIMAAKAALRADLARELLANVCRSPGATIGTLAESVGVTPSAAAYHLHRFEDVGLACLMRRGRSVQVHPGPMAQRALAV
jgi:DNA-binding transcriptional ArsR family regulator